MKKKTTKTNAYKKNVFIEKYKKCLGNVTKSCEEAKIDRSTFYDWIKDDEDFKRKIDDINEQQLDFAESTLFQQMKAGNTTATIFFLKTKGRKRGYVEKHDVEVANHEPIVFTTTPEIKELIDKL